MRLHLAAVFPVFSLAFDCQVDIMRCHAQGYELSRVNWGRGLALLCCAGLPLLCVAAASDDQPWVCRPGPDAQGWQCEGREAGAPADFDPDALQDVEILPVSEDLAADFFVPRDELPAALTANMPAYCEGAYQEPIYALPRSADSSRYPVVTEADSIEYQLNQTVTLDGGVRFSQGKRALHSASAVVDQTTRQAQLKGGVRLQEPGVLLQGDQANVNLDTKESELNNAQFLLFENQYRGRSERVEQNEAGDLNLQRNTFTRCDPGTNTWQLKARSLTIKKGEVFGTARGATLRVKNVPIFYAPYLKFPVSSERQSGFLFPNVGYSDEDGSDLSIPYYLNLAPNYDATLIPRLISERGASLQGELRHLSQRTQSTLSGALLPEDDLYNGLLAREDFEEFGPGGEFEPADRWLYALDHLGQFGRFTTVADVTAVSDRDYFRDLGTDLAVSSRIELERRGELRYNHGGLSARLWAQRFQRLDEITVETYQRLPELAVSYRTPIAGPLEMNLSTVVSSFDRNTQGLNGLAAVTGERAHIEPRLRLPFSWPFGFFTATAGFAYTQYDLEQDQGALGLQLRDDTPDRSLGFGSLDGGLFFERDLQVGDTPLVQTLEPRLYYLYREFEDQSELPLFDVSQLTFSYLQLFRDNRFAGIDRIGDANQASFGLTTRFLNANTGREYFRASVGQIFFFEDRQVTLGGFQSVNERQSTSAYAVEVDSSPFEHWRFRGTLVWDPNDNEVDEGAVSIQYRRDNGRIFNVGYRNRAVSDIRQTDVSLYWPVSKHFSLISRWNYDLVSDRTIERFGGIEFNNCCWQMRLISRRFLDSPTGTNFGEVEADEGIFVQFVFKGLAGFGTQVEAVLQRGIPGYRTPQRR